MKINFSQGILNLEGKVIQQPITSANNGPPTFRDFTLRSACVDSLLKDDPEISGQERFERGNLALAIHASSDEPYEISTNDIVKLKDLIGKTYTALVVCQAWRMLEGN